MSKTFALSWSIKLLPEEGSDNDWKDAEGNDRRVRQDSFLSAIIDITLDRMDVDKDGYVTYTEYRLRAAQQSWIQSHI